MATADRIDTPHPARGPLPRFSTACPRRTWRRSGACWAACCSTPRCATRWRWKLRADDFYADANQKLYTHILALHDEGKRIDTTLLVERLRQAGELEAVGGTAYLAEVLPVGSLCGQRHALRGDRPPEGDPAGPDPRQHRDPPGRMGPRHGGPRRGQPGGGKDLRRPRPPHQRPGVQHPRRAGRGLRADRRPAGTRRGGRHPHRFPRPRRPDRRAARLGVGHLGRPAEHGQDRAGHQHRRICGHRGGGADACL